MSHKCESDQAEKRLDYQWTIHKNSNYIKAIFQNEERAIKPDTLEEFIYEHYYGFTKVSETETWEYKVNHPRWNVNPLIDVELKCDFKKRMDLIFLF